MEENPYKSPTGAPPVLQQRRLSLRAWLIGVAVGIPFVAAALIIVAVVLVIVVAFFLPYFVDIRENPRYWDEMERRHKTRMAREDAVKSISEERRAAEQDAQ